jgi:signal transduction histidine kinase
MEEFKSGLGDAWASIATFVPKLIAFLLILVIGYFIAKAIAKVLDGLLERVGFDRAVERGGVGQALAQSRFDASDILAKIVFWALFLFVLQMAFGVFGPNPISDLIKSVIAYLPKLFVAIVIVVVGAAIAAAVKEIIEAALGGLSYGRALAFAASTAILVVTFFAALAQLDLDAADKIFNPIFYSILAIIVGSAIVAIGGGGIQTMSRYWQRAAQRAELESSTMKQQAQGSKERIKQRASERRDQAKEQGGSRQAGATTQFRSPDRP